MMLRRWDCLFCLGLLVVGVLSGCSRTTAPSGNWGSSLSSINDPTTQYSIVRLEHDKHPYLLLAVDMTGRANLGGGTGHHQGRFVADSGTRVLDWSCSTDDGVRGQVVIAGQSFDLSKGNLFLASTHSKPASVIQLAMTLEDLQEHNPPGRFSEAANKESQIASFLNSASNAGSLNSVPIAPEEGE